MWSSFRPPGQKLDGSKLFDLPTEYSGGGLTLGMAESRRVASSLPPRPLPPLQPVPLGMGSLGGKPHFRLFGIPVRVSPGFWFMAILLGGTRADLRDILIWSSVVFFSVILHELGHAIVARAFGATPAILLYTLGGVTVYSGRLSRARSGFVSAAGPLAGLLFGSIVWLVGQPDPQTHAPLAAAVWRTLVWANVGWGVLNLVPVIPFDGGHIMAALLGPKRALATAIVSAAVGASASAYALAYHWYFVGVLFATAAINGIGQVRSAWADNADVREGLDERLLEGRRALDEGDTRRARDLALEVSERARTDAMRDAAGVLLAWIHVADHDGPRARSALARLSPRAAIDPYTLAAVEDAAGNAVGALQILEIARQQGMRAVPMSKLLIDLYARAGELSRAVQVAADDVEILGQSDSRKVLGAAFEAKEYRSAALLADRLLGTFGCADDAVELARAHSRAGQHEAAFSALERAVALLRREVDGGVERISHLASDPAFETLSTEERFRRIVGV